MPDPNNTLPIPLEIYALRSEIAALRRRTLPMPEAVRQECRAAQVRADEAYRAVGADGAPEPLQHETPLQYRWRLFDGVRLHSKTWGKVSAVSSMPDERTIGIMEAQGYPEVIASRTDSQNYAPGEIREVTERDAAGRTIRRFIGDPMAVWGPFMQPYRHVMGIDTKAAT